MGCRRGGEGGCWIQSVGPRFKVGWPGDPLTRAAAFRVTGYSCTSHTEKKDPPGNATLGSVSLPVRGLSTDSNWPLVSVAIKLAELH